MEQNFPIIAKKFWNMVRVVYFMLRKGISKGKLLADLIMLMKRGKIAGKAAIHSLMFHHHHHGGASSLRDRHLSFPIPLKEYEFSCSNTTAHTFHLPSFHVSKRNKHSHAPPLANEVLMAAALQMMNSASASPILPGFGPSPMVRQLRVTDSPFPLRDCDVDSHVVDEAAEEFIMRFYKDLKQQNDMGHLGYY